MTELSDRLRRLATRGTPRGASDVFAAAQADAARPAPRVMRASTNRLMLATAVAAAVMLVAGVAGAFVIDGGRDDEPAPAIAAPTTASTLPPATTTTIATEPVSKIYLASTRLVPFSACPSLVGYARSKALDTVGPYGLPYSGGGVMMGGAASTASRDQAASGGSPAPPAAAPAAAAPDFSSTNVQEAGIDEPDVVKTDGRVIFSIAAGKVVATAAGADPGVIGAIRLDNASQLLLTGTKLIVISGNGGVYADAPVSGGGYAQPTRFSVVDVRDPSAMKFEGSFDVDGAFVSARLVDGVARLVVRSYPKLAFTYPTDGSPEAQAAAVERNRDIVRSAPADAWLPHFSVTSASGTISPSRALVTCGDSYHPPAFSGFGMLSVITFNTAKPADSHATAVMADGQIVYASGPRLYVATNSWNAVQNNQVTPGSTTLVHAFDIHDPTAAQYLVSGQVRGTTLNQFSMSEYNGLFRIATTDSGGGSESFLTVLQNTGEALVPVGQVGGLGKGERIMAVRFIDATAYVVTFRQTDPLYVIDLSEPTKPKRVGELQMSGYSSYLHPIGNGRLLGIGREADPNGRTTGLQASIFDVSNPAAPRLVARKVLDQGYSSAEFDHHAFLYWAPTNLAVIPLRTYDPNGGFNGAVGMRINATSIDEVGRMQPPGQGQYGAGIERSIVIGDRLYEVAATGILVNRLDNLQSTAWVPYPVS